MLATHPICGIIMVYLPSQTLDKEVNMKAKKVAKKKMAKKMATKADLLKMKKADLKQDAKMMKKDKKEDMKMMKKKKAAY